MFECEISSTGQKRECCSYDAQFKPKVSHYAKDNNYNSKLAREFNIMDKLVHDWQNCAGELEKLPKTKKCHGCSTTWTETTLHDSVLKNRESSYCNTLYNMIPGTTDFNGPLFKPSVG